VATGVRYLALLRGVNVGGNNLVKMADLRSAFEGMGFEDVSTYIASGNVLFRAPRQKRGALATRVESELSRRYGSELKAVLLTEAHLKRVVGEAPRGFGADSELCDVIFVRSPLTVRQAFAQLEFKEGVDRAWAGRGVIYFSRLASRASSSRLSKFAGLPVYKSVTVRSWSTTRKLLALIDSRAASGAE
jgi:uncharacterized protein (DUF1697 family)